MLSLSSWRSGMLRDDPARQIWLGGGVQRRSTERKETKRKQAEEKEGEIEARRVKEETRKKKKKADL